MTPTSLYLHLPFCASKCSYCDFNSIVAPDNVRLDYLKALEREIERTGSFYHERLFHTVYFGGGTPTLYPAEQLCRLLAAVRRHYTLAPDAEVTIEANPGTVSAASLTMLREMGCNRLSLGVQSLDPHELRMLGRGHDARQAREAFFAARAAGFGNLSVDLINCLPGQTVAAWLETLTAVVRWQPDHLSCYGLSIEEGTELGRQAARGVLRPSEEGAGAEIYEATHVTLVEAGYEHYEISNYCRRDRHCRHNQTYWRSGEYVGLGAGATSTLNGHRLKSEPDPRQWAQRVLAGLPPALVQKEALDDRRRAVEVLMLALRTSDGLDLPAFCAQFGLDLGRYEVRVKALAEAGLADWDGRRLALTPVQGFLLHSEIVQMFM
jgi:oxygen-independent coproporphyrinogen-3 oxidase